MSKLNERFGNRNGRMSYYAASIQHLSFGRACLYACIRRKVPRYFISLGLAHTLF